MFCLRQIAVPLAFQILAAKLVFAQGADANTTRSVRETAEIFFPELQAVLSGLASEAPLLGEEREKINEAKANRMVTDSKHGFQLSLGVNAHSLHENRPNSDYYHRYRFLASAYIRKPLYHWGALRAESRISELAEISASSAYADYAENLASRVRSDYLVLVLAAHEIELAQRSLKLAESNVDGMQERLRLGLVTALAVSEARIAVLRQRINLTEKERFLARSKRIFREETGFGGDLNLTTPDSFIDFAQKHVFAANLPILAGFPISIRLDNLERFIETENQRIAVAEAGLRPKLNLVGGFYQDQVDSFTNNSSQERNNALVGVEANWALFDSSLSRGQKGAALARKRRYQMQLERETRRLRMEFETLREYLVTLGRIIESSRQLVAVSKDRFEKSQIEFDRNRITPEIFFSSRLALDQARLSLFRSVANYLDSRGQYERYLDSGKN